MSVPRRKPDHQLDTDSAEKMWILHNDGDVSVIWHRIGRKRGGTIHKPGRLILSEYGTPRPGAIEFPAGTYFVNDWVSIGTWWAWTPQAESKRRLPPAERERKAIADAVRTAWAARKGDSAPWTLWVRAEGLTMRNPEGQELPLADWIEQGGYLPRPPINKERT